MDFSNNRWQDQQGLSLFVKALTVLAAQQSPETVDKVLTREQSFAEWQMFVLRAAGGLEHRQQVLDIIVV